MASPGAYNSNQVATIDDYVMTSLASARPGQAKTSAPPSSTRTSSTESESTSILRSAVIYGPRNALSPSGGGSGQPQFLLYYCYGELVVRPVGLFTGDIASEYARVVPYLLRRSNGQIRWLQYDSSDYLMVSDLKMVMEVDVALQNTANINNVTLSSRLEKMHRSTCTAKWRVDLASMPTLTKAKLERVSQVEHF